MKRLQVLTLLVVAMLATGCAAGLQQAKQEVLSPAVELAWPGIERDALVGADTEADSTLVAVMGDAVETEDCDLAFAAWLPVEAFASRGINRRRNAGEIGPLGAETKFDNLILMGEALARCAGEPEGDE